MNLFHKHKSCWSCRQQLHCSIYLFAFSIFILEFRFFFILLFCFVFWSSYVFCLFSLFCFFLICCFLFFPFFSALYFVLPSVLFCSSFCSLFCSLSPSFTLFWFPLLFSFQICYVLYFLFSFYSILFVSSFCSYLICSLSVIIHLLSPLSILFSLLLLLHLFSLNTFFLIYKNCMILLFSLVFPSFFSNFLYSLFVLFYASSWSCAILLFIVVVMFLGIHSCFSNW